MKITTFLLILMSAGVSLASIEKQDFKFNYTWKNQTFNYETKAISFEDALPLAAEACFKHFKEGHKISKDEGIDIIDICVNPKPI